MRFKMKKKYAEKKHQKCNWRLKRFQKLKTLWSLKSSQILFVVLSFKLIKLQDESFKKFCFFFSLKCQIIDKTISFLRQFSKPSKFSKSSLINSIRKWWCNIILVLYLLGENTNHEIVIIGQFSYLNQPWSWLAFNL